MARSQSKFTLDVVVFSPLKDALGVLVLRVAGRPPALPYEETTDWSDLLGAARALVKTGCGADAAWIEQLGAFADHARHPLRAAAVSIAFVAVIPAAARSPAGAGKWISVGDTAQLMERQRAMVQQGLRALRTRMDYAPIAFRLLPTQFTLGELQQAYELLLGRRLHKASFRRALHAAALVAPVGAWRSEARGRPAQYFAYAPRKRRRGLRGVRFDTLAHGEAAAAESERARRRR